MSVFSCNACRIALALARTDGDDIYLRVANETDAKIFRVTTYNIHIFAALPLCHITKFNPGELHHEIDEETW